MKTLITVVVTLLIGTAAALKCYVCNTGNDSACGDEFNADSPALQAAFIQECGNSTEFVDMEPFCRKTKEYMDVVVEYRVHRECGYMKREGYDCYQKRAEDYVQDVCQCTSDLCNTAPSFKPLTPLLALTLPFFAKFIPDNTSGHWVTTILADGSTTLTCFRKFSHNNKKAQNNSATEVKKVMQKATILSNGVSMPLVGFGTYKIRGHELIFSVVKAALEAGYRSFDTAAVYRNEKDLGEALLHYLPKFGLTRKDIFITSKLSKC
ncbi:hypothetical protein Pcinc_027651 [Petrolisthes cinctipes]|uniref:NADP-dependent oxidoreductase domain-containing protein n=1 Tax=Petrolisthes cinctipes TaxID=88211 RepID=A0AAE1F462_PETCI|nr:hypothetical protein Pcinc_027651 [Petrolisthes cinctipes]